MTPEELRNCINDPRKLIYAVHYNIYGYLVDLRIRYSGDNDYIHCDLTLKDIKTGRSISGLTQDDVRKLTNLDRYLYF